jgi:coiled-coil and C2 domain-containing protein 2A
LQRCRDILYINVFDLVEIDLPATDREREQVVRKRISRNWLGSVKIPFSNIYVNGKVRAFETREPAAMFLFSWKVATD